MPSSMYDKLGDLLSRTLDTGEIPFVTVQENPDAVPADADASPVPGGGTAADSSTTSGGTDPDFARYARPRRGRKGYTVYKFIPPEVARCYAVLGLTPGADRRQVKAAYKQRLKALHPDRHAGGAASEEQATSLTQELVESYRTLTAYLSDLK